MTVTTATVVNGANSSRLPGVNVLLEGPTGTGKTHAVGTLVDAGLDVYFFAFESGAESLVGYYTDRGLPVPTNLYICTVKGATASWNDMADAARQVNTLSYEGLKKISDPNRSKYDAFEKFLRSFNDITDDTGRKHGSVDKLGTRAAVVVDGCTGLGNAVIKSVIGGKADRDQKDWGLSQNLLENFLRKLCDDCPCHFILLAHVERETDPVLGGSKITISTLGRALAPKIPPMFSDVILATRVGKDFFWDTENAQADLKTRNLPISAKIKPDFGQIIAKWKSRGGAL